MDRWFAPGFFGTRAPLFMDIVSLIVLLLPFLIFGAIMLAKHERYRLHITVQTILFVFSVIVVLFFEIGVRWIGGYEKLMQGSSVSHRYIVGVLIFHIMISVMTLLLWIYTLITARRYRHSKTLPGLYTSAHRKDGYRTFGGIVATVLTGAWVYMLLFVY